jgi:hypothetical protein
MQNTIESNAEYYRNYYENLYNLYTNNNLFAIKRMHLEIQLCGNRWLKNIYESIKLCLNNNLRLY